MHVGREGFEPSLTGPEPAVLPLDDLPRFEQDVTQTALERQEPEHPDLAWWFDATIATMHS